MKRTLLNYLTLIIALSLVIFTLPLNSLAGDMEQFFSKELKIQNDVYQYFSYDTMTDLLIELEKNNSEVMSLNSIGTTYEGRDIWMVKLSDNVESNEDEPGILLIGSHHGNEWPSFEILIYFIRHMVELYYKVNTDDDLDGQLNEDPIDGFDNDDDGSTDEDPSEDRVRDSLNNTQIFLIPMLNPDGVEYGDSGSRKNRVPNHGPFGFRDEVTSYGVNLNRNYGFDWILYYLFPIHFHILINLMDASFNYRGPSPFSENETRAVKSLVENQNICLSVSFHSYSEIIFYPWYHTSKKTPHEDTFISIGENMSKINKYRLLIGGDYIIPKIGGTLGTYENWAYGAHNILAFNIELCRSRIPTNTNIVLDTCLKHAGVGLYLSERAQTLDIEKIKVPLLKSI
jgi:hypothetical protein